MRNHLIPHGIKNRVYQGSLLFVFAVLWGELQHASAASLIRITDPWKYSQGDSLTAEQNKSWQNPEYDDSTWSSSFGGFAGGATRLAQASRLYDFGTNYHTVLFRRTFEVENPAAIQSLFLRLQYQHGVILWLNGHPIFKRGLGDMNATHVALDAFATVKNEVVPEEWSLNEAIPWIRKGSNLLAVQVHSAKNNRSFTFAAELSTHFARPPMVHQIEHDSAVISWRTLLPTTGKVRYGLTSDMHHLQTMPSAATENAITLKSLIPGCRYHYQVVLNTNNGTINSEPGSFTTDDTDKDDLRFAVLGDSGKGTSAQYRVAEQLRTSQPDLVVHTGDTVYPYLIPALADTRFYSVYGMHMSTTPYYMAAGNHDMDAGPSFFPDIFHLPVNHTSLEDHLAAGTSPESYYTFQHGPAQFFILYAPFLYQYDISRGNIQLAWLENELSKSDRDWKFIIMHHPIQTSSLHRWDDYNGNLSPDIHDVKDAILPMASRHGVQIVFSGHDHVYERFMPNSGVLSITSAGGGGGLYGLRERDLSSAQFHSRHHFVQVSIDNQECLLQAIDDRGQIFDTFHFNREQSGAKNHQSTWHSPQVEDIFSDDLDGNVIGQAFDFRGQGIVAPTGQYSHAGELHVHNDAEHLYIGLKSVSLPDDGALFLFSGPCPPTGPAPTIPLSFPKPSLSGQWTPALFGILGDEFADATHLAFHRSGNNNHGPQGLFLAGNAWIAMPNGRIQQYNRNPQLDAPAQLNTPFKEQNADYIELAMPFSELPGMKAGDRIYLAVITGKQPSLNKDTTWTVDSSHIGTLLISPDQNETSIRGITVDLAAGPDNDMDGLSKPVETALGTTDDHPDTDNDGLPDGWEVRHGLSPLDSTGLHGAFGDPDQDFQTNHEEWKARTHPTDATSLLKLETRMVEPRILQFQWMAIPGVRYQLQAATSATGPFAPMTDPMETNWTRKPRPVRHHLLVPESGKRFFQVHAEAQAAERIP